jgi:hypothetical protein
MLSAPGIDLLERELRRPRRSIRIEKDGSARMNWAGYLLCAATAALVANVDWWAR